MAPAPNWRPSWNIAPTQDMFAVVRDGAARVPRPMRWGLIPAWSKEEKPKFATFNARAETVETAAAFRNAWRAGRRCLIVTDGFYEWRKSDKQPFCIQLASGKLTILAGLWEAWRAANGETVNSCTVLTTAPNRSMAALHDRMPVILDEADWPAWLGEESGPPGHLRRLLAPCPDAALKLWPVDRRIGNVRNDGPEFAAPLAPGAIELPAAALPGHPLGTSGR
jgi:putative SOS response-associated peptidase YedK